MEIPDPFEGHDMQELVYDMCDFTLLGMAVLGIRAVLEPEFYDQTNEFVQRSIDTARVMGYVRENGVCAPMDILEIAFPRHDNNGYQ